MTEHGPVFALFTKPVVVGEVKSHLTPPLTDREAARIYEAMMGDTAGELAATGRAWAVLSTDPDAQRAVWPADTPSPAHWLRQTGGDPGERRRNAVAELVGLGYGPVILVGSDHPNIPIDFLRGAIEMLDARDVVIGPTFDGGYYLIGMHRPHEEIFSGIEWSTAWVFRTTMDRVRAARLTAGVLPPWYDVDRAADLVFLRDHLDAVAWDQGPEVAASSPRTRDVLRRLRLERPSG